MSSNEVWAICKVCGIKMKPRDGKCSNCGSSKIRFYQQVGGGSLPSHGGLRARSKLDGFHTFAQEIVSRWKYSRDQRLQEGVNEERVIDREMR